MVITEENVEAMLLFVSGMLIKFKCFKEDKGDRYCLDRKQTGKDNVTMHKNWQKELKED